MYFFAASKNSGIKWTFKLHHKCNHSVITLYILSNQIGTTKKYDYSSKTLETQVLVKTANYIKKNKENV